MRENEKKQIVIDSHGIQQIKQTFSTGTHTVKSPVLKKVTLTLTVYI